MPEIRLPAEKKYAREIEALIAGDKGARPPGWAMTPRAVEAYVMGSEKAVGGVAISPKYIGDRALIQVAIATLASDRALMLAGEPGTAKSWLSEHISAAISGTSGLIVQGTAGTSEEHIKYGWNYALLLAEGPSHKALALNASQKEDRIKALRALSERCFVEAIPAVRASFAGDVSADVREEAAYALAALGDVESVDEFVGLLRSRETNGAAAKIGAYGLGMLGDVRGLDELLRAYAEGWQPGIVAEALRRVGHAAIEPLVTLIESRPEIADRKAALSVVGAIPAEDLERVLVARLEAASGSPGFCALAGLYVTIARAHAGVVKNVVRRVIELRPSILDRKSSTPEEKALARRCAKFADGEG